jgi:hypothetical protein
MKAQSAPPYVRSSGVSENALPALAQDPITDTTERVDFEIEKARLRWICRVFNLICIPLFMIALQHFTT